MRQIMLAAVAALGSLFTSGGFVPAEAQQNLVFYHGLTRDAMEPIMAAFEKKHGVKVQMVRKPTEELMATLDLELRAGQVRADAFVALTAQARQIHKKHNALRPYRPAGLETFPPDVLDPENLVIPMMAGSGYIIQYNKNHVAPEEAPKSFADLLDPKWKNKIVMADPASSATVHGLIWLLSTKLANQAPYGWDYFSRLSGQNVLLTASHGTIRDIVQSGERPIGIQQVSLAQSSLRAGANIGWAWPREGFAFEALTLSLLKNSPNQKSADLFAEYIVSKEGQETFAKAADMMPLGKGVGYSYADGVNLGNLPVPLVSVDVNYLSEHGAAQTRRFREVMRVRR
jgi:iron(III) transport system substrate-binding protein